MTKTHVEVTASELSVLLLNYLVAKRYGKPEFNEVRTTPEQWWKMVEENYPQTLTVPLGTFESMAYYSNLADEEGVFNHPLDLPFDQFMGTMMKRNKGGFDRLFNLVGMI